MGVQDLTRAVLDSSVVIALSYVDLFWRSWRKYSVRYYEAGFI
jgi:hypothetical protein